MAIYRVEIDPRATIEVQWLNIGSNITISFLKGDVITKLDDMHKVRS